MARPSWTFAGIAVLSLALTATLGWSAHHLLLAGAPTVFAGRTPLNVGCLLLPLGGDFVPHLASYLFLSVLAAGLVSGAHMLVRQQRQTQALVRTCLAARGVGHGRLDPLTRTLGIQGRIDFVNLPMPLAFCYGYLRPRVLVSSALVDLLTDRELEAVLLHEREHVRQRDPLKVALGRVFASTVFFMPVLNTLYRRYLVEKELAADSIAVAEQGTAASLTSALVRLIDHKPLVGPLLGAAVGDELDSRVDALLGDPVQFSSPLSRTRLAGSLLVVVLMVLPLLLAPLLMPDAVASSHNIVAGCHLDASGD